MATSDDGGRRFAWLALALVAALGLVAGGVAMGVALSDRDDSPAAAASPAPASPSASTATSALIPPTTAAVPSSTSTPKNPSPAADTPAADGGDAAPPAADGVDDAGVAPPEPEPAPPAPTVFLFAVSHPINCAGGGPTLNVTWESTNAVSVELAIGGGVFTPTATLNGTVPVAQPCAGPVGICARARNAVGVVALECTQANL